MDRELQKRMGTGAPTDYGVLMESVHGLCARYPAISFNYLGNSILGRGIPLLSIGTGDRHVLYVGAHHGMEGITASLLLRFIAELCDWNERQAERERLSPQMYFKAHTLHIVPMLNPDGVEYQQHGVEENNPLCMRAIGMNGGSRNFSRWQANARGVDLNHNYDADFDAYKHLAAREGIESGAPTRFAGEYAESEPEVASLCNLIRFDEQICGVITLHTQGEEIFCGRRFDARTSAIAHRLARLCGYRLSTAVGLASMSGLTDWCNEIMDISAFTLECGKGKNPLPPTDAPRIYTTIRRALLLFPTLL